MASESLKREFEIDICPFEMVKYQIEIDIWLLKV